MVRYHLFTVHLLSHCRHLSCCTIQLPYSTAAVLIFNSCQLPVFTSCQCLCQTAAKQYYSTLLTLLYTYLHPVAESLDEIQAKFSSLLFTVTSTALPWGFYFFRLTQPLTVSTDQLQYTVEEKGGKPRTESHTGGKPVRKPYPLPYGLRNPKRNLKSENSQDYSQKPQRNCEIVRSWIRLRDWWQRRTVFSISK